MARYDGENFDLSYEVNAFLQTFNRNAPRDGLYVIEMGSNDVRDAIEEYLQEGMAESLFRRHLRPSLTT